jgi:hypothetical protein
LFAEICEKKQMEKSSQKELKRFVIPFVKGIFNISFFFLSHFLCFLMWRIDVLTEQLGLEVMQHIFSFMPPVVGRFASLTCSFWKHTIR